MSFLALDLFHLTQNLLKVYMQRRAKSSSITLDKPHTSNLTVSEPHIGD